MTLTRLETLGDWVLLALVALDGQAEPAAVLDVVARDRAGVLTARDHEPDPEREGFARWQSRIYLARRYLGEDQLVLSDRRSWRLTPAGRTAAAVAGTRLGTGTPAVTRLPEERAQAPHSVIATPLLDPDERSRIGLPVNETAQLQVVIELNLRHSGGARQVFEALLALWPATWNTRPTLLFDEYVRATLTMTQVEDLARLDRLSPGRRVIHRIWPDFPVEPHVDVSARTIKVDAARRAFSARGRGITWAVIDSGIDDTHPHFDQYRTLRHPDVADLHRDFTLPDPGDGTGGTRPGTETVESALVDVRGHGTHVAGIIAGGLPGDIDPARVRVVTEEITDLALDPVVGDREVEPEALSGMAPLALLVSLKVLPPDGPSDMSRVMAALRYVREINASNDKVTRIHGVNLSLGYEFDAKWFACGQSPLCKEVDRLVRSGVVVVVAAGNTGYGRFSAFERQTNVGLTMTINDPGNAARAITVGSTHREAPHTYGVSYFSSKGPTGDGRLKPDLLAPGERITSCGTGAAAVRHLGGPRPPDCALYLENTGTSFAAPHVSGAVAAFLSVRPEFVGQPEVVKDIVVRTATSLGRERYFEGGGLLDLMRALQAV